MTLVALDCLVERPKSEPTKGRPIYDLERVAEQARGHCAVLTGCPPDLPSAFGRFSVMNAVPPRRSSRISSVPACAPVIALFIPSRSQQPARDVPPGVAEGSGDDVQLGFHLNLDARGALHSPPLAAASRPHGDSEWRIAVVLP